MDGLYSAILQQDTWINIPINPFYDRQQHESLKMGKSCEDYITSRIRPEINCYNRVKFSSGATRTEGNGRAIAERGERAPVD